VKGHLDRHWSEWFDGLVISILKNGEAVLSGEIVDQAALRGVLAKVRELNLPLISVTSVSSDKHEPAIRPAEPYGEIEGPTVRPTTRRVVSVAALILIISIVGFILAVIFDWPGLARFGGPPSPKVTVSDIMQGTLTSIPLPPMIALAVFAILAQSRRWWGTLAVVALCLLGVLFFFAALAEVQPNPYVPQAVLVGAIVAYLILSLLLVLSGAIDLIDRVRLRGGSLKVRAEQQAAPGGVDGDSMAQRTSSERRSEQYSLAKILGIWALAAAPMGILGWIVFPLLAPDSESDPLGSGVTRLVLLTLGLVWLFVLSMIIVRREEGNLRWATVKRRLRLNAPREPATGEPRVRLWLWVVPFIVAVALVELVLDPPIENVWVSVFPFFKEPAEYSFDAIFQSQEILQRLEGAWWFFALFVVQAAFNTILGEEFLFRGVLLPKMEGVFGRWSWVANGILFGLYHVHQPWGIPNSIFTGLLYTFPAYRYRSTWMSIILHSAQSVYFAFLVLGVVLGLA
jgi:uncharacterized protein